MVVLPLIGECTNGIRIGVIEIANLRPAVLKYREQPPLLAFESFQLFVAAAAFHTSPGLKTTSIDRPIRKIEQFAEAVALNEFGDSAGSTKLLEQPIPSSWFCGIDFHAH
jgi:hypothetical protein